MEDKNWSTQALLMIAGMAPLTTFTSDDFAEDCARVGIIIPDGARGKVPKAARVVLKAIQLGLLVHTGKRTRRRKYHPETNWAQSMSRWVYRRTYKPLPETALPPQRVKEAADALAKKLMEAHPSA